VHGSLAGYVYRTKDGRYLTIVPILEPEWARTWECVGLPDMAKDERLRGPAGRREYDELIQRSLAERFATKPLSEWMELLEAAEIPAAAVRSGKEFIDHPQAWENDMLAERQHSRHGRVRMMNVPVRLSDTPGKADWPPPEFGQHTREVLIEVGYSEEDVEALARDGIVVLPTFAEVPG